MKKLLSILVLSLLFGGNGYAAITVKGYLNGKSGDNELVKKINSKLVLSAYSGILAVNTELDQKLFCPSDDLKINEQMTAAFLETGINKFKDDLGMPENIVNQMPASIVLLDILKDIFPCK